MDLFLTNKTGVVKLQVPSIPVFQTITSLWNKLSDIQKDHLMDYLTIHKGHINWSGLWENGKLDVDGIISDDKFKELCRSLDAALTYKNPVGGLGHSSTITTADTEYHGFPQ